MIFESTNPKLFSRERKVIIFYIGRNYCHNRRLIAIVLSRKIFLQQKWQKIQKKKIISKGSAENRYAKFQYTISETIEAGIELLGTEVKSIRNGKANLRDGYCSFRDGEILLLNVHISPHKNVGSFFNHDPLRNRKLLLHKKK